MKKRLYSVLLLFSFFCCSGGFLVGHAASPYLQIQYRDDASGVTRTYRTSITGKTTVPSIYYIPNSEAGTYTNDMTFLSARFYYGQNTSSSLYLEEGSTVLFGIRISTPWVDTINGLRIGSVTFSTGEVISASSVGKTVGKVDVSSYLVSEDYQSGALQYVLLLQFTVRESFYLTFIDLKPQSPSVGIEAALAATPVVTSSDGSKWRAVAGGFWSSTVSGDPSGGLSSDIENQTTVIVGEVQNSVTELKGAIQNSSNSIISSVTSNTGILKDAVLQVGQDLSNKVEQAASDITSEVRDTGQAIQDKIDEQYDISDSSQVGEAAQGFADQAAESLGVVSYIDTLFSGLSGLVTAGSTTLTFPALAFAVEGTEYQFWEEYTFDLSQLDGWFSGLMAAVRLATSTVVVGAVIHYLQSVYKDVIG